MTPEQLKLALLAFAFVVASSFFGILGYVALVAPPPPPPPPVKWPPNLSWEAAAAVKWPPLNECKAETRAACESTLGVCEWRKRCVAVVRVGAAASSVAVGRSKKQRTKAKGGAKARAASQAARLAGRETRAPAAAAAGPAATTGATVSGALQHGELAVGDVLQIVGEWAAGETASLLEGTCLPEVTIGAARLAPNCTAGGIQFNYKVPGRKLKLYPAARVPLARFGFGAGTFSMTVQRLSYGCKLRVGRLPLMLRGGGAGNLVVTPAPNARLGPLRLVPGHARALHGNATAGGSARGVGAASTRAAAGRIRSGRGRARPKPNQAATGGSGS